MKEKYGKKITSREGNWQKVSQCVGGDPVKSLSIGKRTECEAMAISKCRNRNQCMENDSWWEIGFRVVLRKTS